MAFAAKGEQVALNSFTGAASPLASMYLALCSDSNGTEIDAENGYTRAEVPCDSDTWNTATGSNPASITNKVDLAFDVSTGAWNGGEAIEYAALYDSGTPGEGNLLCVIPLDVPVTVSASGQTVKFLAGDLTLTAT